MLYLTAHHIPMDPQPRIHLLHLRTRWIINIYSVPGQMHPRSNLLGAAKEGSLIWRRSRLGMYVRPRLAGPATFRRPNVLLVLRGSLVSNASDLLVRGDSASLSVSTIHLSHCPPSSFPGTSMDISPRPTSRNSFRTMQPVGAPNSCSFD